MRKTKIVCTLGTATDNQEILRELMKAGMNVARINFSHGNYKDQSERINIFKRIREKLDLPIPLILDTQGPEIRIGKFQSERIFLEKGQRFTFINEDILGDNTKVSISYKNLYNEIDIGRSILVNDGTIELIVREIKDKDIICEVIQGGYLTNRKSVNILDLHLELPSLNQKDIEDITYGIRAGFDYIAASFIRTTEDSIENKRSIR